MTVPKTIIAKVFEDIYFTDLQNPQLRIKSEACKSKLRVDAIKLRDGMIIAAGSVAETKER